MLLERRELLDCSMSEIKSEPDCPDALSIQRRSTPPSSPAAGLFKPLKLKQRGLTVEISWAHLNLQEQETFINNYTVYYAKSQRRHDLSKGIVKYFFPSQNFIGKEKAARLADYVLEILFFHFDAGYQRSDIDNFSSFARTSFNTK